MQDTAETYPIPAAESNYGRSEKIIGEWLKKSKIKRKDVVISASIAGFNKDLTWCRKKDEYTRITRSQVIEAVDEQLKRLGTDYIDILQFQWPDRYLPIGGVRQFDYELEKIRGEQFEPPTPIAEQLEIVAELLKSGKIRAFGLSNETPYGVTSFLKTAELLNLPKPCSLQNPYNLLERNDFESGMQECCAPSNGNLAFFAYSPLAGGALTGKYQDLYQSPVKARMRKFTGYGHKYISPPATEAVRDYLHAAKDVSLPLGPLSLAWLYSKPYVTSTIIGATSTSQLEENLMALNIPINEEINDLINEVYRHHTDPTKGIFPVIDLNQELIDPAMLPWGSRDQDVDPELDVLINSRLSRD